MQLEPPFIPEFLFSLLLNVVVAAIDRIDGEKGSRDKESKQELRDILDRLRSPEAKAELLLQANFRDFAPSEGVVKILAEKTGGDPLWGEELTRWMLDPDSESSVTRREALALRLSQQLEVPAEAVGRFLQGIYDRLNGHPELARLRADRKLSLVLSRLTEVVDPSNQTHGLVARQSKRTRNLAGCWEQLGVGLAAVTLGLPAPSPENLCPSRNTLHSSGHWKVHARSRPTRFGCRPRSTRDRQSRLCTNLNRLLTVGVESRFTTHEKREMMKKTFVALLALALAHGGAANAQLVPTEDLADLFVDNKVDSAEPMRQVQVQVTSQQDLAATGEWSQKSEDVWQRDIDGVQAELAFGFAAVERSLEYIDSEIDRLGEPASRQQQLDLLELKLRRDELLEAARRMLVPSKSTQTSQQTICGGQAEFTHWYGQTWFYTYSVRSTSRFGMPGPVSPYTKTAYARAKACNSSGTPYCDEPAPVSASTTSYAVTAEVLASRGPATGAAREAFGYVLVIGACTEVRSFSTSVPN